MKKFEMGPVQKTWIQSLKDHPERQMSFSLGKGTSEDYKACCLGEYLICYHRLNDTLIPFFDNQLFDGYCHSRTTLSHSDETLGLLGPNGRLKEGYPKTSTLLKYGADVKYLALAHLNDNGMPWSDIAEYIETYPEYVFTKAV